MIPPKLGNESLVIAAMLAITLGAWYPPPAAVDEAGPPMNILTLGFGEIVLAQLSLRPCRFAWGA